MVHLHRVNTDVQILGNHFGHILGFEAILNGIVDFYDITQVAAPARGSADDKTGIKSGAHNYRIYSCAPPQTVLRSTFREIRPNVRPKMSTFFTITETT